MLENYFPVLVFVFVGIAFGIFAVVAGSILAPHKPNSEKLSQYECGFSPFENSRLKFDVRFYLVAILFILFDLEIAFLLPWAVVFRQLTWGGIIAMGLFLLLLLIGFLYEWKKGALEWE
jgi:NADH-quinone oxidoreductase subunit A